MFEEIKINPVLRKLYREKGYWTDQSLLDYWESTVASYPTNEYVVDDRGFRYTYKEMDEAAAKVAAYLDEKGIGHQDIVSYQIPIWSEFVILTIACLKIGAVAHPVALSYEEQDLIRALNTTESKIYFGPTFFHKTNYEARIMSVKDQIPSLQYIVLLDNVVQKSSDVITLQEILMQYSPYEGKPITKGEDIAVVLCTSGTTGGTKGVLLTHDNIKYSEEVFYKELGLTSNDIMFMPAPLNHATGFHHGIIAPMMIGAKVVLQQRYNCKEAIDLMNKERCTYSMGATPFIYDILREMKATQKRLPYLKLYLCGGAPVPGYLVKNAAEYGILLCEVYGSTESVPHVYVHPEETLQLDGSTSGRAIEGIEVKVVDELGNEVPFGTPGEEVSRGPNMFVGYLKAREITDGVLDDDGWFHSGDLCIMDEHRNIKIVGRKKDMIVRGGENLNSNEINDALEGCPGVFDHAVIGMPDERLGERICVFIEAEPGYEDLQLQDILDYLISKHVPKRLWPEHLELIERIPYTGSGKVKKYLLKEELNRRLHSCYAGKVNE